VSIWDLLEAFDTICKATGTVRDISNIKDDTPIDLYQIEILHRLQTEGPMTFERIFESRTNRVVMIGLFLALLELIREKLAWVEQASGSSIYVRSLTEEPAEQAVQEAILASEAASEESDQAEQKEEPPIPIAELSTEMKAAIPLQAQQSQTPIPITELPSSNEPAISRQEQQEQQDKEVMPVEDHKTQTAG
jgi:hypothetical protein